MAMSLYIKVLNLRISSEIFNINYLDSYAYSIRLNLFPETIQEAHRDSAIGSLLNARPKQSRVLNLFINVKEIPFAVYT